MHVRCAGGVRVSLSVHNGSNTLAGKGFWVEQRPRAGLASDGLSPWEFVTDPLNVTVGGVGSIIAKSWFVEFAVICVHAGVVPAVFGRVRGLDALSEALLYCIATIKTMVHDAIGDTVKLSVAHPSLVRRAEPQIIRIVAV